VLRVRNRALLVRRSARWLAPSGALRCTPAGRDRAGDARTEIGWRNPVNRAHAPPGAVLAGHKRDSYTMRTVGNSYPPANQV